jgi:O-antigen/teichoic acid export membrane protein
MSYLQTTLHGLSWTAFLRLAIRLLTFVRIAILARILLPFQFGIFGIASLSLSFLEILTETGINSILIQQKDNYSAYLNTAYLISILRGVVISLLMLLTAPIISTFFSSPQASSLLYLAALVAFIRGFINPASVKFQKELYFHKEFYYRLTLVTVEAVAVIFIAFVTRAASSMVWSLVVSALAEVILSHAFIKPRPQFQWNAQLAKDIFHRGKWITGFGILDYIYTTGDNITVGKILGQAPLGIYQNAYKLSTLPITELVDVFYKVTFPVYVQMRDYPARLKTAVLKSTGVLTVLLLCSSLIIYFFADLLVKIILGPNWLPAIPVIKILAFLGFFRGTSTAFNSLFMALHQQKQVTYITLFNSLGLLVTIVPLVSHFGLTGAGYSAIFGAALSVIPALILAQRAMSKLT